jgi:hypothetical protein
MTKVRTGRSQWWEHMRAGEIVQPNTGRHHGGVMVVNTNTRDHKTRETTDVANRVAANRLVVNGDGCETACTNLGRISVPTR